VSNSQADLAAHQWPRTMVCVCAYNEGEKLHATLSRFPSDREYDVVVVDDGSSDGSTQGVEEQYRVTLLRHEVNLGVGRALKSGLEHFLEQGYEVFIPFAGNNKDEPLEIPRLVEPIAEGEADFVQGSRFLSGASHSNMPLYRVLATRLHPLLMSLVVGKWLTESTNGFRAIHRRILDDPRIDWRQEWLDKYELEPYLLYKAITLGYRHMEVPCTKVYPPRQQGQTKMKAFTGWWSILRPVVLLGLRLKR